MMKALGWWFPEGETHLVEWMERQQQKRDGKLQYQYTKYTEALRWVATHRCAIDVGANIGLWSYNMAKDFVHVHAFEPVPKFRKCWSHNMLDHNATIYPVALGAVPGTVKMINITPGSHGDTCVLPLDATFKEGQIVAEDVEMRTLDSFNFINVGLIKIDCEGYEKFVVQGGEATIKANKPCIIVEQKKGHASKYKLEDIEAVDLLLSWGAELRGSLAGDFILSW